MTDEFIGFLTTLYQYIGSHEMSYDAVEAVVALLQDIIPH
jgi:hypothetical protein